MASASRVGRDECRLSLSSPRPADAIGSRINAALKCLRAQPSRKIQATGALQKDSTPGARSVLIFGVADPVPVKPGRQDHDSEASNSSTSMKCIKCEKEARAVCQFCGGGVCAEHISEQRFVTGYTSVGGLLSLKDNALSVEDAAWCGVCHPEYHRSA